MNNLKYYQTYIVSTNKILQCCFKLPEIPIKIMQNYNNCTFYWGYKNLHFVFDVDYMKKEFNTNIRNRERRYKKKIKNIKELMLFIVLHEIGHYYHYTKLGREKYEKIHSEDWGITYTKTRAEKFADNFSIEYYEKARGFLKE